MMTMETAIMLKQPILRMFYCSTDHVRALFDLNANFILKGWVHSNLKNSIFSYLTLVVSVPPDCLNDMC